MGTIIHPTFPELVLETLRLILQYLSTSNVRTDKQAEAQKLIFEIDKRLQEMKEH